MADIVHIDYKKMESLYNQGLLDKTIAFQMDCCRKTVIRWRKKNNKPPNRKANNNAKSNSA